MWTEAKAYCEGLTLAGGGWRLPYVRELITLSRVYTSPGRLDRTVFPNQSSDWFWSATENYMVSFNVGDASPVSGQSRLRVRCVR